MKYRLNKIDTEKFLHNVTLFLIPLGIMYLSIVIGVINQAGHLFSMMDFIPNAAMQGAIVLWLLNAALDFLRKLQ